MAFQTSKMATKSFKMALPNPKDSLLMSFAMESYRPKTIEKPLENNMLALGSPLGPKMAPKMRKMTPKWLKMLPKAS